jgi:hypothetical protein
MLGVDLLKRSEDGEGEMGMEMSVVEGRRRGSRK